MNNKIKIVISWIIALWASKVFLSSLFYKFDETALEPQHIFSTIGTWMSSTINVTLGELFTQYGAIAIGSAELITSVILLSPIILWKHREKLHYTGGLMASIIMSGAVFFHLFTPLGWVPTWCANGVIYSKELACAGGEVFIDQGLAWAALSILILGIVMVVINKNK